MSTHTVNLTITPSQVKSLIFQQLRSTGYPVDEVLEVKMYPGGTIIAICEFPDSPEEKSSRRK